MGMYFSFGSLQKIGKRSKQSMASMAYLNQSLDTDDGALPVISRLSGNYHLCAKFLTSLFLSVAPSDFTCAFGPFSAVDSGGGKGQDCFTAGFH